MVSRFETPPMILPPMTRKGLIRHSLWLQAFLQNGEDESKNEWRALLLGLAANKICQQ